MIPETLSHYSLNQFFVVLIMMSVLIVCSYIAFISIYYGGNKILMSTYWICFLLLIFNNIMIETAYTIELVQIHILIFRALNTALILSIIGLMWYFKQKRLIPKILTLMSLIIHITLIALSFYFHYTAIYLSVLSSILIWISFKPTPLSIIIEKKASEVLSELKEAIIIISTKGKILLLNQTMAKLLDLNHDDLLDIKKISTIITGNENTLKDWLKGNAEPKSNYYLNGNYYLINKTSVSHKGLIITASEITEYVLIQNELKQSISELKTLTKKLQDYSLNTEIMAVKKEKTMIFNHIQEIVRSGLVELYEKILLIKDEPPANYDYILQRSRLLLNEIREIVTNWRTITGATQ